MYGAGRVKSRIARGLTERRMEPGPVPCADVAIPPERVSRTSLSPARPGDAGASVRVLPRLVMSIKKSRET